MVKLKSCRKKLTNGLRVIIIDVLTRGKDVRAGLR